ncbi:MAG: 30S ribosomal protein S16 [Bacteroidota bacterium]
MAVKIRLARRGKKDYPVYSIIVADARAPRDGRFIQKLGTYNPNHSPSQVNIQFELLYKWLSQGAEPTETMRAICSSTGMTLVRHLAAGIRKGAISIAVAKKRFIDWYKQKEASKTKKFNAIITSELVDAIFKEVNILPKKEQSQSTSKASSSKKKKPTPKKASAPKKSDSKAKKNK